MAAWPLLAEEHGRPEVAADPNVYPSPEAVARAFTVAAPGPAAERARARSWSRFKAGR